MLADQHADPPSRDGNTKGRDDGNRDHDCDDLARHADRYAPSNGNTTADNHALPTLHTWARRDAGPVSDAGAAATALPDQGAEAQATFLLPGHTYGLKIAVHPTEGWPAIAAMTRFTESDDPIQSFVRVFNPKSGKWSTAQQVDIGVSSNGMDRYGSTVVGITGDGVVHAVWGASDPGQDDAGAITTHAGLWASDSADYGTSWSAPEPIAEDCWTAEDIATSAVGWIVVTASCYTLNGTETTGAPTMIVRRPDGTWLPPEHVRLPGWQGSDGALAIVGDGDDARAISVRFGTPGSSNGMLYLISKRLVDVGDWHVEQRDIVVPDGPSGERHYHPAGLVFPQASGTSGVIFTWTGASTSGIYALTSLDGGQRWGAIEPIVYDGRDPEASGSNLQWASPAYDPAANRLVVLWTCCGNEYGESTHYASTSIPGSGVRWPPSEEMRVPVVLGSRIAWNSVGAQSANARVTWVAWVEAGKEIHARSINLNQLVPIAAYPTITPRPSPTATGGTP